MEGIFAALIGTTGGIIITILGLFAANRAGIGKTQEKVISNLKDLVDIQEKKIAELERKVEEGEAATTSLRAEVVDLQQLTIRQAALIDRLQRQRRVVPKTGRVNENTTTDS